MQFRTKARAVDLLGKGQIADLPTAITELWKNGYDAYADNLTAEIYLKGYKGLKSPWFVMTDDGKGMSREDIFDKWLVLGTDSKSRTKKLDQEGEETLWKKPRIKAGEKGIGRLSVAFLGSPMLMLTKKIGEPLQALFFDWRLLENYNLFLDDINIPVEAIDSLEDFDLKLKKLTADFLQNFEKEHDLEDRLIWEEDQEQLRLEIENSVKNIQVPHFFCEEILSDIVDINNVDHHGTKFVIFEPIQQVIDLSKDDYYKDDAEDNSLALNSLLGFTNIFNDEYPINYFFFCKKKGRVFNILTAVGNFFQQPDFDLADVLIQGFFNGEGEFQGTVTIYDKEIKHTYINPRKKYKKTNYGSFYLKLGYVQGLPSQSKLKPEIWKKMNDKVVNYGGIYIYRDNFRVLPYGRTENDFLDFEKRRLIRAGDFYFSHRRMFGYLALSRERNEKLKDKSSREGLLNNSAYKAFKSDLISFFVDLAKEYFGTKPRQSIFRDKQKELKEQAEVLKADKKREIAAKRAFTKALKSYPKRFEEYQKKYKKVLSKLDEKSRKIDATYREIEDLLEQKKLLDIEYKDLIPKISRRYKPTSTQLDRLEKYETQLIDFEENVKPESEKIMQRIQEKLEIRDLKIDFQKNARIYIGHLKKLITTNKTTLEDQLKFIKSDYTRRTNRIIKDIEYEKEKLANSINSKPSALNNTEVISGKFEILREQLNNEILPLVEHLSKLNFDINEELVQGAYKAEYDKIKYQWEQTRETAQLGIAVEIIDHEFNQLYASINHEIRILEKIPTFQSSERFDMLKKYFRQLEDKYDLLSPLYRISGVVSKNISCLAIYNYLQQFFSNKIKEENITFTATESYINHSIFIKEPVIHTVFINIINNAIYWVRNSVTKQILLDYKKETNEILIINSGVRIENHRIEKIFDLFYSNRPNGRGLGLYLSKQSLVENYFDIYATNDKTYNRLKGACFVIKSLN